MKILLNSLVYLFVLVSIFSCKEQDRYNMNIDDKTPPGAITYKYYKALYGGARFFYSLPSDEDLLGVEGEYTNSKGKTFKFNASYFVDSLDIYGLPDMDAYVVRLYAVDRAGNRSTPVEVNVEPLEPAYQRVARNLDVRPGFGSFFVDWSNELKQDINVYVDYEFADKSGERKITTIFSSKADADRRFVYDLDDITAKKVKVKVRVEDAYGNITPTMEKGEIVLLNDELIPKKIWSLPNANDSIGGVPMMYGNFGEGRTQTIMDDIINEGEDLNFLFTGDRGRTGRAVDKNVPWNLMIDLGDYYELSRIVTHQRRYGPAALGVRGKYYREDNVGSYNMYYWDEDTKEWVLISYHQIPIPTFSSDLDFAKAGRAGDMAYMYPDFPTFTKKTRWFRYEAVSDFSSNYTGVRGNCLSEVTLYGRKATN